MRKLLVVLALFVAPWASAQDCTTGSPPSTFASEKLTISSTGVGFTAAVSSGAIRAYCSVETDAIRFLVQVVPTATTGILVPAGSYFQVCGTDISRTLLVRVTTDATINCLYQR